MAWGSVELASCYGCHFPNPNPTLSRASPFQVFDQSLRSSEFRMIMKIIVWPGGVCSWRAAVDAIFRILNPALSRASPFKYSTRVRSSEFRSNAMISSFKGSCSPVPKRTICQASSPTFPPVPVSQRTRRAQYCTGHIAQHRIELDTTAA